ncbi:4-hydroxyphenylacetate 3-hydroxylase N-terminal domain-containing protein [Microbacterium gorillae]|uniref:4-hydroxyphenylacetate 3-hydroxylase N-terminal domain-containing protein n=1 Tax=Microbacterium gorillae TaxID=1231063 RepID=UPI00058BD976|nr:4-hydroxyphenylacetate 3-hydroxylase N-terminal domain-containing protein [Microbacterium gorillae]
MTLRTADEYREGLRDGRRVIYRGQPVADVTEFDEFDAAIAHSAHGYSIADTDPGLAVAFDDEGTPYSAFYRTPRSPQDLIERGKLIETVCRYGVGTIVLKEVGSDALFGLLRATVGEGRENAQRYWQHVIDNDVALAVAQSDVKGDRAKGPSAQADPDLYLHVVAEDEDSITVCGAKVHTSFSANADELIVIPTRALGPGDEAYAVAFAIPVDTPGVSLYVSPYLDAPRNSFEHPISSQHKMLESLTVFDNVRVPKSRVFLNGEVERAGQIALAFVDYHRFTAINYKLPLLDALVGAASLVAEANGISRAAHVRAKMTDLISYTETVRGFAQLAAVRAFEGEGGVWLPDPLSTNLAKYHFAHGFPEAVRTVIDLAGGLVATGPGGDDWADPEVRAVLEKYFAAAVPAEERLRIIHLIGDLFTGSWGGYQTVLATHAEGSLEAEKLQISRSFDAEPARAYVRDLLARATEPAPLSA